MVYDQWSCLSRSGLKLFYPPKFAHLPLDDITKEMIDQGVVTRLISLLANNNADALDVINQLAVHGECIGFYSRVVLMCWVLDESVIDSIGAKAMQHILNLVKSRPQDVLPKVGMVIHYG